MPGPVTHIILADKVFDRRFPGKDQRLFYLGTLFPDIRYLGVIGREQTHPAVSSMEEIAGHDDFHAGILFHALCDQVKREYMAAWHRLLKQYLSGPPDPELMINLARQAGIQPAASSQPLPTLDELKNNQAMATLVADFTGQFDTLISKYSS